MLDDIPSPDGWNELQGQSRGREVAAVGTPISPLAQELLEIDLGPRAAVPGLRKLQLHQQRAERVNLERVVGSLKGGPPDAAERAAVLGLWRSARHDAANTTLSAEDGVRLITGGWAGWLRYADDGQRLIFLFLLPGDFIVPSLFEPGCCEVVSLTGLRTVDASPLTQASGEAPKCAAMIARCGRDYRLLLVDHLTRLTGGCTTRSVAHLLNEFYERSLRSGWSENGRFGLPIGQRVLARALGRSPVQINKIINQFQADGLVRIGYNWVDVLQPEALRKAAGVTHSNRASAQRIAGMGASLAG